jgi:hypothetical protein
MRDYIEFCRSFCIIKHHSYPVIEKLGSEFLDAKNPIFFLFSTNNTSITPLETSINLFLTLKHYLITLKTKKPK